jgi:hypothetical protein
MEPNQSEFPVVNAAGKLVGLLSHSDLVRILSQRGPNARVADAMTTMVPTIGYRRRLRRHVHLAGENRTCGRGGRRYRAFGRPTSGTARRCVALQIVELLLLTTSSAFCTLARSQGGQAANPRRVWIGRHSSCARASAG